MRTGLKVIWIVFGRIFRRSIRAMTAYFSRWISSIVPKFLSDCESINFVALPPDTLIALPMEFPMVHRAQGHGKLVRDLPYEGRGLRELQVMSMRAVPSADQAGLRGHEGAMARVALPARLGTREHGLVDPYLPLLVQSLGLGERPDLRPVRPRERNRQRRSFRVRGRFVFFNGLRRRIDCRLVVFPYLNPEFIAVGCG